MTQFIGVPIDLGGNQILNAKTQLLGSDPGTPADGDHWINTTTNLLKWRVGGTVYSIPLGPITSALIQDGTITDVDVAAANKDGVVGTASMRTIGTGAQQAMAGSTRLDTIAAPTGPVALNAQKITGLADGTANTDAVTKQQLDGAIAGMDMKASVRAASTATVGTVSGATLTATPTTLDGVTLVANDRVLVKDHSTPAANGIYTVTTLGTGANGVWTRATDFDAWAEVPGSIVAVEQGTVNADRVYLSTADQSGTLGTTAVTWSLMNPVAAGGLAKFAQDITGNGALTQFTVTHNLNSTDVQVQVWDVANDLMIITDIKRPTTNTVRIDFATAVANAKVYRVVVIG